MMSACTLPHRFAAVLTALLFVVPALLAQSGGEPVVETNPAIPTADQPVTIYFNADQGTEGLKDHDGDVYAHTGVFTDQSPDTWRCVKNYWPTDDRHDGNRSDTKLTRVEPNRYKLVIDSIRAYYNANETGCTLNSDETIQTLNFVFRNADGSKEGKGDGGKDIVVELGDANAEVLTSIETPRASTVDPLVTGRDTTVSVLAVAQADGSLQEFALSVDGTQQVTTTGDSIQYDLALTEAGRKDVRVTTTDERGNTAKDSVYAVRAAATPEASVPSGMKDGINYNGGGSVTLALQAPRKDFVHVVGDFTEWEVKPAYQMSRETITSDSVRYWIRIDGLQSGTEYGFQYLVDGEIRIPDPYSEKVLSPNDEGISDATYPDLKPYPSGKANQLVSVLEPGQTSFNFSDFTPPKRKDLIIYELLVRDFIEKHNYQTLQDTLAYLDRLGINAIELMPVSEYDGNKSWGYNPALYFAPDKYYGPARELKRFIEMAHQRGIAVILDVVYNQMTGKSPFVRLFNDGTYGAPTKDNPWVNRAARHPFNVFYDNNHESAFTRYWLDRANEYWLTEFNIDGFRFDLSKGFTQGPDPDGYDSVSEWSSYDAERVRILKRMAREIWSVDGDAYVILEHFAESEEEQELASFQVSQGRPGMILWNNMNHPYSQAAMGVSEGSGLSNSYYGNRGLGVPNYITYMSSHDEQWLMHRNRNFGNSSDEGYSIQNFETAIQRQKLVGSFFFTVPGPRMIWQFSELGYGWASDECLKPGGGSNGTCPESAPGRTAEKPIRWQYRDPDQSPHRVDLYKTWAALIELRNQHPIFTSTETDVSMRVGAQTLGRRIGLQHSSMDAVIIGNFDVDTLGVAANFPSTGTWYDYFSGQSIQIESDEQDTPIPLAPGEFHIFTSQAVDPPAEDLVPYDLAAPPPEAPSGLETTSNFDAGTISLGWSASSSSDVVSYRIYRGQAAAFDTSGSHIASVGAQTTSYTDTTVESSSAYYYRVAALDSDGALSEPTAALSAILQPDEVSIRASRSFGDGSQAQDYRLIALPGTVDRMLSATFDGQPGNAWQAYWDDGSSDGYFVEFDGSSTFRLRPGRGFWAISESPWSIQETVPTVTLSRSTSGQVAVIDLHDGWNIISNPLSKDVQWSEVDAINDGPLQPLWRFDGTFSQTSTFASAQNGEAFYFHNQTGRSRLLIPYATASGGASARTKGRRDLFRLRAQLPEGDGSRVFLGTADAAADSVGPEDVIAPPTRFERVSLRVRADEAEGSGRQASLIRTVRAAGDDGEVYHLSLHASSKGPVTVDGQGVDRLPGTSARLINRGTGESYELREGRAIDLGPADSGVRLAVVAGSASFVKRKRSRMLPSDLDLRANYPNPFRTKTQIEYTLPEAGAVKIEVFDVLGRRVRVLVDERREAGAHRVSWNGENESGRSVASGVYLTRLTFEGKTRTQKMVLVK